MDTIKLTANGHDALLSKKSVTIDGKEYLYTGISAIKHSSAKHVYLFKYEDNWHPLFYNEADKQMVATVFKKVAELNAKRAKAAKAQTEAAITEIAPKVPVVETLTQTEVEAERETEAPAEDSAQVEEKTEETEESAQVEEKTEETEEPAQVEEKTDGTEESAQTEETTEEAEEPTATETEKADSPAADTEAPIDAATVAERKHKLRKAIIIFAIIIALFVGAGVAYFFFIGPANDASKGSNVDETHHYNDIEEMIDEMQK